MSEMLGNAMNLPRPEELSKVVYFTPDSRKEEQKKKKEEAIKKEEEPVFIKLLSRTLNLTAIHEYITYTKEDKDGNSKKKLDKIKVVDKIIDLFSPIFTQNTLYLYENGVFKERQINDLKTIINRILPSQFSSTSLIQEISSLIQIDYRVNIFRSNEKEEVMGVMNTHSQDLINVKNGMLNIKTLKLIPHSPTFRSTIQFNANWNPDAKCPKFMEFIKASATSEEAVSVLQEYTGYSYTNIVNSRKRIAFLDGDTGTGKSVFLNAALENIIPRQGKSHVELQKIGEDKFASAQLVGKVVNIFDDLKGISLKDVATLKTITGSGEAGEINVERKGQDAYSTRLNCKLFFCTNGMPQNLSNDKTDAIYDRMLIFEFNNKPKDRDVYLESKLKEEADGIFLWAITGLKRFIENDFKHTYCKEIEMRIQEYKESNNSIILFVKECLTITKNPKDCILKTDLEEEYIKFCTETLSQKPLGKTNFKKHMALRYGSQVVRKMENGKQDYFYTSVRLKEEDEIEYNTMIENKWAEILEEQTNK